MALNGSAQREGAGPVAMARLRYRNRECVRARTSLGGIGRPIASQRCYPTSFKTERITYASTDHELN
jgi:hypothetical protein